MRKEEKMKKVLSIVLCFVLLFSLCACGANDAQGEAGDGKVSVKWDFCVINSLTHPSSVLCQQFADEVYEATDGQVEITVRAPGELSYSANDYLTAVGDGSIQISDVGSNCYGVLKVGAMSILPYLADNLDDMDKVMNIVEPYLQDELAEYGAKYLFYYVWPAQSLWTNKKELTSLSDIKGLKIRTSNNELSELVKIWGGTPVSLTGSEVPAGLQTGVVDGVITSAYGLGGAGWDDSLKYGLITNCQIIPDYICVNAEEFEALPEDIQNTITELAAKYQKLMNESMFSDEEQWRKDLAAEGMVINTASEEDIANTKDNIQAYWDQWAEERGGDCTEVLVQIRSALGL